MSTYIQAFIPDDDPLYQKHKKVFIACRDADVSLPKETADYFGTNYFGTKYPDNDRVLEEKLRIELIEGIHYSGYFHDTTEGIEVNLTTLPKGVTKLRFINSW